MDAHDITSRVVAGAVAGAMTVTGIKKYDRLILVQDMTNGVSNLSTEFTVTDNTITNTGGTSTSGHQVLVVWEKKLAGSHKFEMANPRKGTFYYKG